MFFLTKVYGKKRLKTAVAQLHTRKKIEKDTAESKMQHKTVNQSWNEEILNETQLLIFFYSIFLSMLKAILVLTNLGNSDKQRKLKTDKG